MVSVSIFRQISLTGLDKTDGEGGMERIVCVILIRCWLMRKLSRPEQLCVAILTCRPTETATTLAHWTVGEADP